LYSLLSHQFDITIFRRKAFVKKKEADAKESLIRFIDIPSGRVKGLETLFHSFLCTIYCLAKRPDLIHIHNIGPGMFIPLLKLFNRKVVLTYHSPNYEHEKWGLLPKTALRISEYLSTQGADKIIFVNNDKKQSFPKRIQSKSVFIPNGVNIQQRSTDTQYIASLGLQPGKYLLTVGRITQEKGLDCLTNAFLLHPLDGYKLVIAGGVDYPSRYATFIKKQIQTHPTIIGTGYVEGENLRQLYSHAALFILASRNEGFPLVLLEAISYGLPVLASDIAPNLSLNLQPSDYFKVNDTTDLAQQIARKLFHPTPPYPYDLRPYTWKHIAERTADIFLSLAKLVG